MADRQQCIACSSVSPETNTNYTLISSQHGWRLTRARDATGKPVVEWRCPECWQRHKAAQPRSTTLSGTQPDSPKHIFAQATKRLMRNHSEPPGRA